MPEDLPTPKKEPKTARKGKQQKFKKKINSLKSHLAKLKNMC